MLKLKELILKCVEFFDYPYSVEYYLPPLDMHGIFRARTLKDALEIIEEKTKMFGEVHYNIRKFNIFQTKQSVPVYPLKSPDTVDK